jgi:hypothetical protein
VQPYNLIETRYDDSTGNLYALHWGPYPTYEDYAGIEQINNNTQRLIYPKPAQNNYQTINKP